MNHDLYTVSWEFPAAAAISHTIYPGASLDPDHATNDLVWLASGVVERIAINSDASGKITISVYDALHDLSANEPSGKPFYAVQDAAPGAVAKRSGLNDTLGGSASKIFEVRSSNALPSVFNDQGLRWKSQCYKVTSGGVAYQEPMIFWPHAPCIHGMAIRIDSAANLADAVEVSIGYRPDVLGAQRRNLSTMKWPTSSFGGR